MDLWNRAIHPNHPVGDAPGTLRDRLTGETGDRTVSEYSRLERMVVHRGTSELRADGQHRQDPIVSRETPAQHARTGFRHPHDVPDVASGELGFAMGTGGYLSGVSAEPVTARYPAQPASVRAARQFVTETLVEAGVTSVLDEARLLVSELATNAVVHAATDFSVSLHISGRSSLR